MGIAEIKLSKISLFIWGPEGISLTDFQKQQKCLMLNPLSDSWQEFKLLSKKLMGGKPIIVDEEPKWLV